MKVKKRHKPIFAKIRLLHKISTQNKTVIMNFYSDSFILLDPLLSSPAVAVGHAQFPCFGPCGITGCFRLFRGAAGQ